jgi:hypothetical protein
MAGGTWLDQNKVLPGVYINYSSAPSTLATIGERGVVCTAQQLDWGPEEEIIEINSPSECFDKLGHDQTSDDLKWLQQLWLGTNRTSGASKVLVWRLAATGAAAATDTETNSDTNASLTATAVYKGALGNSLRVVVTPDPDNDENQTIFYVQTFLGLKLVDIQTLKAASSSVSLSGLNDNAWVKFTKSGNAFETTLTLTGGSTGSAVPASAYSPFLEAIERLTWNVVVYGGSDSTIRRSFALFVQRLCNEEGKKVQVVLYNYSGDGNECVISVYPQIITDNSGYQFSTNDMACWVAGCTAGANANESLTYASHPDAVSISPALTQEQQIKALNDGEFTFFEEFGSIKVLQDINSFISFEPTKGKQFRKNRVIRTIFGYANDAYATFSKYYIGVTPNDDAGRSLLKAELLNLLLRYQGIRAVQNVVADDVIVNRGKESDAVVIETYMQPVDSIEKIYINITIS